MGFRSSIQSLVMVCVLAVGALACSKADKKGASGPIRISGAEVSAAAFKVTKPVSAPNYISSESEIRIEGGCDRGSTISISSTPPESIRCADGTFSFLVSQSADGVYDFVLSQTKGPDTVTRNFQWKRDAAVPAPPSITFPATNPFISNSPTISIKGSCAPLHSVKVSGLPVPLLKCSDRSIFSSFVTATVDGTYELKLTQKSPTGVDSEAGTFTWVRDTKSPDPVKITTANPFRGTQHYLNLTGTCEAGATVLYDGDFQGQIFCPDGSFSIPLEARQDKTFQMTLTQFDRAGNFSSSIGFTWIKEKSNPAAPRLTSPTLNPLENNQSPIILRGTCDTGHRVQISGAHSETVPCTNLQFVIPLEASSDGPHSYSLIQIDPSENRSAPTSFVWNLDTVAPENPSVTSPHPVSHISAEPRLQISGRCENNAWVELSGSTRDRVTCSAGAFAFTLSAETDGVYAHQIRQTDKAGNSSDSTNWTWTRDSSVPEAPHLLTPVLNPFFSNRDSLEVKGTCLAGSRVKIESEGGEEAAAACENQAFRAELRRSEDGEYDFTIVQTSASGIDSPGTRLRWIRDTIAPKLPVVKLPLQLPDVTRNDTWVVSGTCEAEATVTLTGEKSQSSVCNEGSFSIVAASTVEGPHAFTLHQTDLAGNHSEAATLRWIRDTTPPSKVVIQSPASNPYITANSALRLIGTCELGGSVNIYSTSSDYRATAPCSNSGFFEFAVTRAEDGTESFGLTQTDSAGNRSEEEVFEWTLDTSIPRTPVTRSPVGNPHLTRAREMTWTVTCDSFSGKPGKVVVSGDVAGSITKDCSSGEASLTLTQSADGEYRLLVHQVNPVTGTASAQAGLVWIIDTVKPDPVKILTPASLDHHAPGSLSVSGLCEPGATVKLSGAWSQTLSCREGNFSHTLSELTDGIHRLVYSQTDAAGNASASVELVWTRDSRAPAPPVILSPATSLVVTKTSPLLLEGTCLTDHLVKLTGAQIDTALCPSTGRFSFALRTSTEGTQAYYLTQSRNDLVSDAVSLKWTYDVTPPVASWVVVPRSPTTDLDTSFEFSSNEANSKFQCQIDLEEPKSCGTPFDVSVAVGNHTLAVWAIDPAGNTSAKITHSWTVSEPSPTVALYHLESDYDEDSGPHGLKLREGLGEPHTVPGIFGNSAKFDGETTLYTDEIDRAVDLTRTSFTLEGFFNAETDAPVGASMVLVSKSDSSEQSTFEVRLHRQSESEVFLEFSVGLNGSGSKVLRSENLGSSALGRWTYFAVTWTEGTATIYTGRDPGGEAVIRGRTVMTTPDTPLTRTRAALVLGGGVTDERTRIRLRGALDEIRLSQKAFDIRTVPAREYDR